MVRTGKVRGARPGPVEVTLCRRPARLPVGRCKLHGGASTGPRTKDGLARLTASKITHGRTTAAKRAEAKRSAQIGREVRTELRQIEEWALDQGHLDRNWRDRFKITE